MPNQEKIIKRAIRVTYRDNITYLPMILLPNRELMQANFLPLARNPLWELMKQEWESSGFNAEQFCGQDAPAVRLRDPSVPPARFTTDSLLPGSVRSARDCSHRSQPFHLVEALRRGRRENHARLALTASPPEKNRRPACPGRGPMSGRRRKKRRAPGAHGGDKDGPRQRRNPARAWRAVPRQLAARLSLRPAKCKGHCGRSPPACFRPQARHPT